MKTPLRDQGARTSLSKLGWRFSVFGRTSLMVEAKADAHDIPSLSFAPPPLIFAILRIALGAVFLYAAYHKIRDPQAFTDSIRTYEMLHDPWTVLLALTLPWLEAIVGICLIIKRFYTSALILLGGMLLMFLVAILQGWVRGLALDCGCFQATDEPTPYWKLFGRDLIFIAMLAGLVWDLRRNRQETQTTRSA